MSENGYVDSYVAFIDILGFKEFIKNNDFKKVNSLFSDINDLRNEALKCFNYLKYNDDIKMKPASNIAINIISDSIVISFPKAETNSLATLLYVISFFSFNVLHKYNLLCRGAIAEGDFYVDQNIAYGPALVKACIMESKLAVYPRIIYTRSTIESYMKNIKNEYENNLLIKKCFADYDIEDDLYYADYIKCVLFKFSNDVQKNTVESNEVYLIFNSIKKNVEYKLSNETDPHIREKYLYFKKYYNNAVSFMQNLYSPIPFKCDYILEDNNFQNNTQYINKRKFQNYSNNNISNSNYTAIGESSSIEISSNETEKEICSILSGLSLRERSELLTIIYKYVDEHKNKE